MKNKLIVYLIFLLFLCNSICVNAQTVKDSLGIWSKYKKALFRKNPYKNLPQNSLVYFADTIKLKARISKIISQNDAVISVPLNDGKFYYFQIENSGTMSPELQRKFPDIISAKGVGLSDKLMRIRIDMNTLGINALVKNITDVYILQQSKLSEKKYWFIYNKKDKPVIIKSPYENKDFE